METCFLKITVIFWSGIGKYVTPQGASKVVQNLDMHWNCNSLQGGWFHSPTPDLLLVVPGCDAHRAVDCQSLHTCCQSTLSLHRHGSAVNRSWWPVCNHPFPVPSSGTSHPWAGVSATLSRSNSRDISNIRWKIQ